MFVCDANPSRTFLLNDYFFPNIVIKKSVNSLTKFFSLLNAERKKKCLENLIPDNKN